MLITHPLSLSPMSLTTSASPSYLCVLAHSLEVKNLFQLIIIQWIINLCIGRYRHVYMCIWQWEQFLMGPYDFLRLHTHWHGVLLVWLSSDPFIWPTFHGSHVATIGMPFAKVTVELMNCKLPRATGFSLLATGWTTSDANGHFDTVKGPEMPSHMLVGWIGGGFSSEVLGECIGWLLDDEGAEGWGLWGCIGVLAWSLPSMGSGNTGLSSSLPRFDPDAIISLNAVLALLFIHSSISSSLNLENFAVSFSHACFKRMTSFLVEMSDGSQNFLRGHLLMTMP